MVHFQLLSLGKIRNCGMVKCAGTTTRIKYTFYKFFVNCQLRQNKNVLNGWSNKIQKTKNKNLKREEKKWNFYLKQHYIYMYCFTRFIVAINTTPYLLAMNIASRMMPEPNGMCVLSMERLHSCCVKPKNFMLPDSTSVSVCLWNGAWRGRCRFVCTIGAELSWTHISFRVSSIFQQNKLVAIEQTFSHRWATSSRTTAAAVAKLSDLLLTLGQSSMPFYGTRHITTHNVS